VIDALWRLALRVGHRILARLPRLRRRRRQGVVVAVWHRDEVLTVRHSYRPGTGLPGGAPRRGESLVEAARRELFEEVGVEAEADALIPVYTTAWIRIYEYYPCRRPLPTPDRREITAAAFRKPHEVEDPPTYWETYLLSRVR